MPAGDITDILTAKTRIILDEASAGFWTEAQLYSLLTNAQRKCILVLLAKRQQMMKIDPLYFPPPLEPVVKKSSAITTSTANYYAITAITDMIEALEVELVNTSPARTLKTTYLPITKQLQFQRNTYSAHTYDTSAKTGTVYSSIYGSTLQTSFTTAGFPNLDFAQIYITYVYNPPDMTTDVDPVLRADCYDAMVYMAVSDAYAMDGRNAEALQYHQLATTLLI